LSRSSARAVGASRGRIQRLGFFEEVSFDPRQTDYPDQLDLDVKVVERPTGSLSFGAGFSSADSFIISGSVSQTNLFGRGYGGSIAVDIGGESDRFFLNFSDPYFMGTSWGLSTQLFRTETEFEDFEEPERKRHLMRLWLHLHRGRRLAPDFDNRGGIVANAPLRSDGLRT